MHAATINQADVVVYGGTPSGVIAAVSAARHNHSVILIDLNNHLGGMMSGGLCWSDVGDFGTVGGFSKEFFNRVLSYYTSTYSVSSLQVKECRSGKTFEPHVAELIFNQMVQEQSAWITVWHHCRFSSALVVDGKVTSVTVNSLNDKTVQTFTGNMFIDASYEGDLMAGAGIRYQVGREGDTKYGETTAGISVGPDVGKADGLVMAYNYRLCLTPIPGNTIPFPKPANYDPTPWAAKFAARINSGAIANFANFFFSAEANTTAAVQTGDPNHKYDLNSMDDIGANFLYSRGDWARRDIIATAQRNYILGELYYLQNDPGLPASWRADAQQWGFAKDEFTDSGGFPFQLYVREARRMMGKYVLTLNDLTQNRYKSDGICEGSYGTDCHAVQYLTIDGQQVVDANLHVTVNDYDIPYRCLIPAVQPTNLLVPVCLSVSHIADCSVRMEPVYMMLGQAAGDAASLALDNQTSVQAIDSAQLRQVLQSENAILDSGYTPPVTISCWPRNPQPGGAVHLTATFGTLKSPITQMYWDLDGTGTLAAQGTTIRCRLPLEKVYNISFVAVDQAGRRSMATTEVPVGAAPSLDVTLDDLNAEEQGPWNATFPSLGGSTHYSDVFIDAGASYVAGGLTPAATALFRPTLAQAGYYNICFGYRPASKQAANLSVSITANGQTTTQTINEQAKTSPFPFVSLGTFYCNAGTDSSVLVDTASVNGTVAIDAVRWVWVGN